MTVNEKKSILGLIGLASRARKTIVGTDLVCDEIRSGKIHFCILAKDASANTKKRIRNCCEYYRCDLFDGDFSKEELSRYSGKSNVVSVVGILDKNIVKGILGKITSAVEVTQEV